MGIANERQATISGNVRDKPNITDDLLQSKKDDIQTKIQIHLC